MPKLRIGVLYDSWGDEAEDAAEDKGARRKGRRQKVGDAHHNLHDRYKRVNMNCRDVRKHYDRDDDHEDGEAAKSNFMLPGRCRHG